MFERSKRMYGKVIFFFGGIFESKVIVKKGGEGNGCCLRYYVMFVGIFWERWGL